ncbi:MAG: hypothetical protein HFE67_08895 [Erysipelotrichaceae bacterium]|nr:hypothetical protein [Erysipelotrichaceae bacterium]
MSEQKQRIKRQGIRVAVVIGIAVLGFLFCVKGCEHPTGNVQSDEPIKRCTIMKTNINELSELLERSDMCSEQWFQTYDRYVERLGIQNKTKKESNASSTDIAVDVFLHHQNALLHQLRTFRKQPNDLQVDQLQKQANDYYEAYQQNCTKGENQ